MTVAWINGREADAGRLQAMLLANHGHFTTMQVRGGAVRGLGLHLRRLRQATPELFGCELDIERVRAWMRQALDVAGSVDCTLRVAVHAAGGNADAMEPLAIPDVLVTVATPASPPAAAQRVGGYRHSRAFPHLKHVGTFPLFHHQRLARRDGHDDALFVDGDGLVVEGSTWNIGFLADEGVVWPRAAALRGTCEQLLQAGLAAAGMTQETRPVAIPDLPGFRGAFAANSRGIWAIRSVDGMAWPGGGASITHLLEVLESRPMEVV